MRFAQYNHPRILTNYMAEEFTPDELALRAYILNMARGASYMAFEEYLKAMEIPRGDYIFKGLTIHPDYEPRDPRMTALLKDYEKGEDKEKDDGEEGEDKDKGNGNGENGPRSPKPKPPSPIVGRDAKQFDLTKSPFLELEEKELVGGGKGRH
jgi:hypothetical protein